MLFLKIGISFVASESLSPLLDLFNGNLAEDGLRLADLVAGGDELGDALWVSVDKLEELLISWG
jgi:hypothetical protein